MREKEYIKKYCRIIKDGQLIKVNKKDFPFLKTEEAYCLYSNIDQIAIFTEKKLKNCKKMKYISLKENII